ncbi:MAG TPA: hypothetical protein VES67_25580 [Vicinamibacterales bacterium]|nr:hypothetical protein [Vicinamibacterales bacterium]
MRKPGILLLLILTLTIAFATVGQDFRFDQALARERTGGLTLAQEFAAIHTALSDIRGAQASYVAAGQDATVWMPKVTELFARIDAGITRLRQATLSAEARSRYEAAATALTDQIAIDTRARDHVKSDRLIAADIIFENAVEGQNRLTGELDAARTLDAQANQARLDRLTRLRFGMNAASLGFVTLLTVLFGRAVRRETPVDAAASQPEPAPTGLILRPDPRATLQADKPSAQTRLDLKSPAPPSAGNADPRLRPPARAAAPGREALPPRLPPAPAQAPLLVPPPPANLSEVAELCVDLGRVIDSRDVPSLVERAAAVLQAKGVVLWVADSAGAILRPSITHGYPEKVVARLGPLQIDGDNVTSLAFRSMRPQTMTATAQGAPAAFAVPLLTASGCVGVFAAEVKQDTPASELLPLARIIAAQFAALIAPTEDVQGSFAATRSSL